MMPMAPKRVLILGNMDKAGVRERIEALRPWFARRATVVGVLPAREPLPAWALEADLCVVMGGDGTLLSAARAVARRQGRTECPGGAGSRRGSRGPLPLVGVNLGKLGFLAEYSVGDLKACFDDVLAGRVRPLCRMMLEVRLRPRGGRAFSSVAANDVTLSAGPPFRMIDLLVGPARRPLWRYRGDGIVVATATGSTGYNLSIGGPVLEPELEAIIVSPMAPHSLSLRPIVLRAEAVVQITATRVNRGSAVIVDGQVSRTIGDGDTVEVRRSRSVMALVPHPDRTFFQTLSGKLHWGKSPHHGN
jgi:NAD+ kinase